VTHVVTSRPIPPEVDNIANGGKAGSTTNEHENQTSNPQTINPLLLDRSSEPSTTQLELRPSRGRFTFEAPTGRRSLSVAHDVDVRKQHGHTDGVLRNARAMGIKIWALEKLERMMLTMFDTDTGLQVVHGHNTRSNASQSTVPAVTRSARGVDLKQLLRNERINGPSDRDPTVAVKEMVIFKGPFIYIHDIDEKQKPIMVREYAKVSNKEDGDWPQFRSVSNGRCPFVEEVDYDRRDAQRELARQQQQRERETVVATQKHTSAKESIPMQPPKTTNNKRALANVEDGMNHGAAPGAMKQSTLFEMLPPGMENEHSSKGSHNAFVGRGALGRQFGGEPVASGLQPSNITSAVHSQMISSTAATPGGAKAGTSKEVHGLQRKVLERNSGSTSLGQTSSHRMTDFHNVVKEDPTGRGVKRKAKERLDLIEEDVSTVEETHRAEAARTAKPAEKKKEVKRDARVGYCENCMETFADFNEVCSVF
jgi:regulatory subunit for Cdc7p protein kinase